VTRDPARTGVLFGIAAYGLWGVLPLFWKAIEAVPADEILAHRTVWSLLVVALLLALRGERRWLREAVRSGRTLLTFSATAVLLAVNWLTYVWAVNNGRIVESSLGYFINPLLYVVLGMVFLKERLRRGQAVAVILALVAVAILTIGKGVPPWIALTLAVTFGFYGLLRKTARLGSMQGLAFETGLLLVPALAYLAFLEVRGTGHFGRGGPGLSAGLALTGVATAVPLMLFAASARRVTLVTVGLLQYVAPTLQFLIGVVVFREPLTPVDVVGFVLIWTALAIYSADGLSASRAPVTGP
jgi:chloramphenicol-sensitive protein RarD